MAGHGRGAFLLISVMRDGYQRGCTVNLLPVHYARPLVR
jgi:hypothetical protein